MFQLTCPIQMNGLCLCDQNNDNNNNNVALCVHLSGIKNVELELNYRNLHKPLYIYLSQYVLYSKVFAVCCKFPIFQLFLMFLMPILFTVYYGRTLKPPWLYHKFQKVPCQSGELKQ